MERPLHTTAPARASGRGYAGTIVAVLRSMNGTAPGGSVSLRATPSLRRARRAPEAGCRSSARGFTLLEVVVVAVVASIIFTFLTRWVLTLGTISGNSLSQAAAARGVTTADTLLGSDLAQATACDSGGTAIRLVDGDSLQVYVEATYDVGGHSTYLVDYQVSGNKLTRTVYPVDPESGECSPTGDGYGIRVVADGLAAAATYFTPLVGAVAAGPCTVTKTTGSDGRVLESSSGSGCGAEALTVKLVVEPQGHDGGRDTLARTISIAQTGGSL